MKRRLFVASAACCAVGTTAAQEIAYPSRPISLVVPFPAGGAGDFHARMLTQRLSANFGPLIVVNKAGGAGIPAAESVKRAAPNGYTLLQAHVGLLCVNPALYPALPYDPLRDFTPVTLLFKVATAIVVRADSPVTSLAELIEVARKRNDGLTYASVGIGTGTHLLGEHMRMITGSHMLHIPFQGSAPALQNLLAGRVDFGLDAVSNVKPFVDAGKLRVLALASEKRHPLLPSVPTTAQAGFKGLESDFWAGLMAPRDTSTAVVTKLRDAVEQVYQAPTFVEEMTSRGFEILTSTPAQLTDQIARDTEKLGGIVRAAGIKI
jgi:tripartite-type tricarboxylate transporter receptor subunit TctC